MVPKRKQDGNFVRREIFVVKGICGVQFKDRKRSMDLMLMLRLNETIDRLAMIG